MEHVRYSDLKTKVAKKAHLKEKLRHDDRWIARGLLTVFDHQTAEEQSSRTVKEHNGVGFTGIDGEILSNITNRLLMRGGRTAAYNTNQPFELSKFLSPREVAILKAKMPKYANQLLRISEEKRTSH